MFSGTVQRRYLMALLHAVRQAGRRAVPVLRHRRYGRTICNTLLHCHENSCYWVRSIIPNTSSLLLLHHNGLHNVLPIHK